MPLDPNAKAESPAPKFDLDLGFLDNLDLPDLHELSELQDPFISFEPASAGSSAQTSALPPVDGLDSSALPGAPAFEQTVCSTSSSDKAEQTRPSKGQRYRKNKKVCTWYVSNSFSAAEQGGLNKCCCQQEAEDSLESRLEDLRQAINVKEAERQELKEQERSLQAGADEASKTLQPVCPKQVMTDYFCRLPHASLPKYVAGITRLSRGQWPLIISMALMHEGSDMAR